MQNPHNASWYANQKTQTPKTFFKDKAVLKKEVMQSKETQYVQKAYKDANV